MTTIRLGLGAVAVLLVAGCGGSDKNGSDPGSTGSTFTASGSLMLIGGADTLSGNSCEGSDMFGVGDLTEGANVTITNGKGEKVALGHLEKGRIVDLPDGYQAPPGLKKACEFPFTIDNVPAGSPVYSIEVVNRRTVDFTENDADSLKLTVVSD